MAAGAGPTWRQSRAVAGCVSFFFAQVRIRVASLATGAAG